MALSFDEFLNSLTSKGYNYNPCDPDACHDQEKHVHLRTPEGDDIIFWADGTWSPYDLTQPAKMIYPEMSHGM